jgi:hypothetical protein
MGNITDIRTALDLFEEAQEYMRNKRFGEAINAFRAAAAAPDADSVLKSRAQASVELIQEINGFVNTDLMNP